MVFGYLFSSQEYMQHMCRCHKYSLLLWPHITVLGLYVALWRFLCIGHHSVNGWRVSRAEPCLSRWLEEWRWVNFIEWAGIFWLVSAAAGDSWVAPGLAWSFRHFSPNYLRFLITEEVNFRKGVISAILLLV